MNVLFLESNLQQSDQSQASNTFGLVHQCLQGNRGAYDIIQRSVNTAHELQDSIMTSKPSIVHFASLGVAAGGLIVIGRKGNPMLISDNAIADFFCLISADSIFDVSLVVLSACFTEKLAADICKYVPYVVGTTKSFNDAATFAFISGLYRGIADKRGIENSYYWAVNNMNMIQNQGADNVILYKKTGSLVTQIKVIFGCGNLPKKKKKIKLISLLKSKFYK